jgi:hypothetical protein
MPSHGLAAAMLWWALAQAAGPFFPVGVRLESAPTTAELQDLRSLRFNVVEVPGEGGALTLSTIARLLGDARRSPVVAESPAIVALKPGAGAADVRLLAWQALANGARGVVFDGWRVLLDNPPAFAAAAAFADNVTRNAALFSPLRPRTGPPLVRVEGRRSPVAASILESKDALVLIAVNPSGAAERVTLSFTPDTPEAIWQNMETGAAVNFVAGPHGPTYTRELGAKDVVVLMIRKRWR